MYNDTCCQCKCVFSVRTMICDSKGQLFCDSICQQDFAKAEAKQAEQQRGKPACVGDPE